jgi:Zn finger protein HypA/HybF involved in hydrogenase expression
MADSAPSRVIVIGMDRTLHRFTCLKCKETHAARGYTTGCPSCNAPEVFQRKDV